MAEHERRFSGRSSSEDGDYDDENDERSSPNTPLSAPRTYGSMAHSAPLQLDSPSWGRGSNGSNYHESGVAGVTNWSSVYHAGSARKEDEGHITFVEAYAEGDSIFERKAEDELSIYHTQYRYEKDNDGLYRYKAIHRPSAGGAIAQRKESFSSDDIKFEPQPMRTDSFMDDIRYWLNSWDFSLVYLIVLGICSGLISAGIDYTIDNLGLYRTKFYHLMPDWELGFLVWWLYVLIPVLIVCYCTYNFAPHASGSGVPEIKTILSGWSLEDYLHWKNLIIKVVGMSVVSGCGIMLGKPLSHVGAILASELLRNIPLFKRLSMDPIMRQQLLASGAACGVSGNFGAPLGGVLFSIEVTSTYYPLRNYLFAFVSCIFASISYLVARQKTTFIETTFRMHDYTLTELLFFAVVGFFGGVFGIAFVKMNNFWVTARRRLSRHYPIVKNPYFGVLIVASVTAVFTFPGLWGSFAGSGNYKVTKAMLTQSQLTPEWYAWGSEAWGPLLFFFAARLIGTAWSTTLVLPGGAFVPLIATGSVMGRIIGEFVHYIFPNGIYENTSITPGVYAAIGSAALLCGGTHSLSAAAIVFELTGQLNLITPMLIAVIVSYYVATEFGISIWDQGLVNRGLPWLPAVRTSLRAYKKRVRDFMSDCYYLTAHATRQDVVEFLNEHGAEYIPIVDDADNRRLLGITTKSNLEQFVQGNYPKVIYEAPNVQLSSDMLLTTVHLLFIGMRLAIAPVTESGRLIGVINRSDLIIVVRDYD